MKEIISRFVADTPTFFKRVVAFGLTLGCIGAALMEPHVVAMVPGLQPFAGYLVTIGVVTAAVAKLTVKDTNDIKK